MRRRYVPALLSSLIALSGCAAEASTHSKGEIGLETRAFWPDSDAFTDDYGLSLAGRFQFRWKSKHWRLKLGAFGRVGGLDQSRSILFAEDAYIAFRSKWVRIRLGTQVLNWSATEAFHPADIINSRNLDSNLENAEKLGEPMVSFNFRLWKGARLEAFYMPLRLPPRLPGTSSRLSFSPTEVEIVPGTGQSRLRLGDVLFVDRDGAISRNLVSQQWGARLAQTVGGADIALQVVQHNDRNQPSFAGEAFDFSQGIPSPFTVQPIYGFVTHAGLTYTHVVGDFVIKLESAYRYFHRVNAETRSSITAFGPLRPNNHVQVAAGLEYGWVYPNDHEATIILEGQAFLWPDGRARGPSGQAFQGPFENDILLGYRHSLNDADGKEFFLTFISDITRWPEILVSASYSQRLSDVWGIKTGLRFIWATPESEFPQNLQALNTDHQLNLSVTRYF